MPENDKLESIDFPLGGVSKLQEYQEQPPGTTVHGENVRGINPDSLRERGGSRAGLVKYIADQVPSGSSLIQHLAVIVDPQARALGQNFIIPGDDWVEDELNPGFFVPPGGWGYQSNPNAEQPPGPGEAGGYGELFGIGRFTATGSTPADLCDVVHVEVTYQAAFSSLSSDPGGSSGQFCECADGSTFVDFGPGATINDMQDATSLHAWLVANAYVGASTTPAEVIATFNTVVDDPDGCDGT